MSTTAAAAASQQAFDEWLSQAAEPALEPELEIVDAHHHLWRGHPRHKVIADFMPAELAADISASGHRVVATVYMQSGTVGPKQYFRTDGPEHLKVVGETEAVAALGAEAAAAGLTDCSVAAGIVATVDIDNLRPADAGAVLDAHLAAAPGRFVGVRCKGGRAEQIDFGGGAMRAVAAALEARGLVLDCNGPETHPLQLAAVLSGLRDLAAAHPRLTVVVDHCGGAVGPTAFDAGDSGAQRRAEWEAAIDALAALPNVRVKVGGLQMVTNGLQAGPEHRERPVGSVELEALTFDNYARVISAFGPARCMFESNFPVDKAGGVSYGVLWNTFKRIAARLELSASEKRAIFAGTAADTYKLHDLRLGPVPDSGRPESTSEALQ